MNSTKSMANPQDEREKATVAAQMLLEETLMDISERLNAACTAKCIKASYDKNEMVKDEAVCLDRCVTKYLDLHEIIGKRLEGDAKAYHLLVDKPIKREGETQESSGS
ncbi:TIM10-like protein [Mya arenaria]|uniref:Mitochondrial import inner membrane translocase subunit n=1 Tax=Mya arenaria TaxID=6604 RepID=A0ABY7DZD2_MYAAR|nr:mitochondrial import inner membrane translocase subunit Tim10-like [Mya arenaria]WAR03095.1 TIM10-like protein [Mya arenaria]